MIRQVMICLTVFSAPVLLGCGSGGPKTLDAAGEQALREDMARVSNEEQQQRRKSTGMANAAPAADPNNFHPESPADQR